MLSPPESRNECAGMKNFYHSALAIEPAPKLSKNLQQSWIFLSTPSMWMLWSEGALVAQVWQEECGSSRLVLTYSVAKKSYLKALFSLSLFICTYMWEMARTYRCNFLGMDWHFIK